MYVCMYVYMYVCMYVCMSEVCLDDTITDSQVKVDGYIIERNDRNRHWGGVAIYIKHDLNYTLRDDLDMDIKCLCLQCKFFLTFQCCYAVYIVRHLLQVTIMIICLTSLIKLY